MVSISVVPKIFLDTKRQPGVCDLRSGNAYNSPGDRNIYRVWAELIKTAVIGDAELFGIIENNYSGIMAKDNGSAHGSCK